MSTYSIPKNSSITINDPGESVTSVSFSGLIRDFSAPDSPLTTASVKSIIDDAGIASNKTITLKNSVVNSLDKSVFDVAKVKGFTVQKVDCPFCIEAVTRTIVSVTGSNVKQGTTRDVNNASNVANGLDLIVSAGRSVYLWNTSGNVTLTFTSGNAKIHGDLSSIPNLTIVDSVGAISDINGLVFPTTVGAIPCLSSLTGLTEVDITFPGNVNLSGWFENCTSLVKADIKVKGNLTGHSNLFKGCTSLVKASLYVDGSTTAGASTNVMTGLSTTGTFYVGGSVVGKFTLPSNWLAVNITDTASSPLPVGIIARETSTVKLYMKGYAENYSGADLNRTFEYSLDNITWNTYTPDTVISLLAGRALFFRGNNSAGITTGYNSGNWNFSMTGKVDLVGCVSSLMNNGTNTTANPCEDCFYRLFDNNSAIVDASKLDMNRYLAYPGDSDGTLAFGNFMSSCSNLIALPILPSKIMRRMLSGAFTRCDNLEYAYLEANSAKTLGLENCLAICSKLKTVVANVTTPSNALTFQQLLFANLNVSGVIYFPAIVQGFNLPVESVPDNWTVKYF